MGDAIIVLYFPSHCHSGDVVELEMFGFNLNLLVSLMFEFAKFATLQHG